MAVRRLAWPFAAAVGVSAVVAVYLVFGNPFAPGHTATTLRPDDAGVTAQGRQVYAKHCAACHGVRLEGQPNWRERDAKGLLPAPPHDASGHTWHHPDEVLFKLTKHGLAKVASMPSYQSAMPVYDGVLSDGEIVAVLSWIKASWPPEIRARHDEMNRAAQSQR